MDIIDQDLRTVRKATIDDLARAYYLTQLFIYESPYRNHAQSNDILALVEHLLTDPNSIFLISDNADMAFGFLAGTTTKFILGPQKIATEIGWWVNPNYRNMGVGHRLLYEFEQWSKEQGCTLLSMGSIDDSVGQYYENKGYVLHERSYLKEI